MKLIGLIGGMSWESSLEYYRVINQLTQEQLGGLHSAESLMYSFDFDQIESLQRAGRWDDATAVMIGAAQRLERGGAQFILICTNTMHLMADAVQAAIHVPLLHIADPTAEQVKARGLQRIGLLGTRFTMEESFYTGRLTDKFGLEVLIPPEADRLLTHRIIYDELVRGILRDESKAVYKRCIADLAERGAQGVILGCTEIGLLIKPEDSPIPIFDTTLIHAAAAVAYALSDAT